MAVVHPIGGNAFDQFVFDRLHRFARRHAGAVADAEDMGVDRHRRLAERYVQHNVRGLAPDAGQFHQLFAGFRHDTGEIGDHHLAQCDDVLRLVPVQPDRLDVIAHRRFAQGQHFFRRVGDFEQVLGRPVHADIGRLGRQHHGDQQGEHVDVIQLTLRFRVGGGQPGEKLVDVLEGHGGAHGCFVAGWRPGGKGWCGGWDGVLFE